MARQGARFFHLIRRQPLFRTYCRQVNNDGTRFGLSVSEGLFGDSHGLPALGKRKTRHGISHSSWRGLSFLTSPLVNQLPSDILSAKPAHLTCKIGSRLWALSSRRSYGVTTRDEHGVYLVGYKLPEGQSEGDFLAAWEQATRKIRQQPGFMYQELCRQVPEWTGQIPGVSDPLPVTFVDFMVFQSMDALANGLELSRSGSLLEPLVSATDGVMGSYSVAISVVKDSAKPDQVVMYNLFEVEDDQTASFIATVSWPRRQEVHSSQPGFVSATLHQRADSSSRFALFNRAEWASADEYLRSARRIADAIPILPGQEHRAGAVRSFPGLFETVRSFPAEDVSAFEAS